MKTLPSPLVIKSPTLFAGGADAAVTNFPAMSGDSPNFETGFPQIYEAPLVNGGKMVKREDMNAIGRMASAVPFVKQVGALFTFDAEHCAAIGGYGKGAVLEWQPQDEGTVYRVRSLVSDNTWDFTLNGLRDDVNEIDYWEICSPKDNYSPDFSVSKRQVISSYGGTPPIEMAELVQQFEMPFDGYVNVLSDIEGKMPYWSYVMLIFEAANSMYGECARAVANVVLAVGPADGSDIIIDPSNIFFGNRNCMVCPVSGLGIGAPSSGWSPIPVKAGTKMALYGYQTITETESSDGVRGMMSVNVDVEAFPISEGR